MDEPQRREAEFEGRARSTRRCATAALALAAVQVPMLGSVWGGYTRAQHFADACTTPTRLAMVFDVGLVIALIALSLRLRELHTFTAPPGDTWGTRLRRLFLAAVAIAVVLDLAEDLVIGVRADEPPGSYQCSPVIITGPEWWARPLTAAMLAFWVIGIGGLLALFLHARHRRYQREPRALGVADQLPVVEQPKDPNPLDGTIVCCSGGGIRSASFCLGGLQELRRRGFYRTARAIVGVSGGGYMAAAHHVLRTPDAVPSKRPPPVPRAPDGDEPDRFQHPGIEADPPDTKEPPVFDASSPEIVRLRRNTRYLAPNLGVVTFALISLAYGLVVNLVILGLALRLAAWVLGWYLYDSRAVSDVREATTSVSFAGDWAWVEYVPLLIALGVGIVVLEKVVDRFVPWALPQQRRALVRGFAVKCAWVGALLTTVLLGAPYAISGLHDLATSNEPTSEVAGLVYTLGFASGTACQASLDEQVRDLAGEEGQVGACGRTEEVSSADDASFERGWSTGAGSLLAILAALISVVPSALARPGKDGASPGFIRDLASRAWSATRDRLLPWVATAIFAVTVVMLGLRWMLDFLVDDDIRNDTWQLMVGIGIFLLLRSVVDANTSSLHPFYRERLSDTFLMRRRSSIEAEPFPYDEPLRFSECAPRDGGPDLVLCASANVSDAKWIATDRNCTPFVFSHDEMGFTDSTLPDNGCHPAARMYEGAADPQYRDATVPAAVAISGAAFSPMTGRMHGRSAPYRVILALMNARLGVWLPNPYWVDKARTVRGLVRRESPEARALIRENALSRDERARLDLMLSPAERAWLDEPHHRRVAPRGTLTVRRVYAWVLSYLDKPGVFRLFKEAFGQSSLFDRKIYVTDGGHYDNLGLVEALRRRPKQIIVLDASSDALDSFSVLGEAIATARMDLHVEMDVDTKSMTRGTNERAEAAWTTTTALHPDGAVTDVRIVKAGLVNGLPRDVEAYTKKHPSFPRTSTGNQLYGEFDFEAYRKLGEHLTGKLLDSIGRKAPAVTQPEATLAPSPTAVRPVRLSRWRRLLAWLRRLFG